MSNVTRVSPLQRSLLKAPLRIVSIGGGTGLSTLLAGLKKHAHGAQRPPSEAALPMVDITAVVTVTDDGGSSGRLRRDFDILPPGDIRNCMTALSEDEALLAKLFKHRFAKGRGLKGHSFGNLFLAAMHQITGDFAHAVKLSSEILAIRGRIFPATSENVVLEAILADGTMVRGESNIGKSRREIGELRLLPAICEPLPETIEAIRRADLITFGPGSLYTSVIPNLLVKGISEAIARSPALKVCLMNLMWQPGETINFPASRHVEEIHKHAGRKLTDCAVLNTAVIAPELRHRYAKAKVRPVENDFEKLAALGVKVVTADLVCDISVSDRKVRHDPAELARVVVDLASRSRARQVRRETLALQRKQLIEKTTEKTTWNKT